MALSVIKVKIRLGWRFTLIFSSKKGTFGSEGGMLGICTVKYYCIYGNVIF